MLTFKEYNIKSLKLKNRIVMPPMCMYSADSHGFVNDFHFSHYITRALGGAGLIIVEATGVAANGRISDSDLGIWDDAQIEGLKRIVDGVKAYGSKIAIQINHAGRKYKGSSGKAVAPSAVSFDENSIIPEELTTADINKIILDFKSAAKRAARAGFDAIEIHAAHGYLIHQFLSPLSNFRNDVYGNSLENRVRFLKEILLAISEVWPKEKPIFVRFSADDYIPDGINCSEMVKIINLIKDDFDIADISSGGLVPANIKQYPGYQVKLAEEIKKQCNIPTIAVGLITDIDMVEEILGNDRADLVALGRELLRNPFWVINNAAKKEVRVDLPKQYERAYPYFSKMKNTISFKPVKVKLKDSATKEDFWNATYLCNSNLGIRLVQNFDKMKKEFLSGKLYKSGSLAVNIPVSYFDRENDKIISDNIEYSYIKSMKNIWDVYE